MFSISRFHNVVQAVPRGAFDRIVARHGGDRYAKDFMCRHLLMAQLFGHFSGVRSLRELETGFNAHAGHHYHLGARPVRRATLADACARRSPAIFEEVVQLLMAQAQRQVRKQGEECLRLLDSTSFTLVGRGFDHWAAPDRTRNTQGLKLHVLYDPGHALVTDQAITAANVNDITHGQGMAIDKGTTYVFDKGYCDYNWWATIDAAGAWFVTRLKANARVAVVTALAVPADAPQVLADEIIRFTNRAPGARRKNTYTKRLRRVTVARPDHATPLVLVTNDLKSPAATIAEHYKTRWQIELFFKWIKQNLRIKTFFGRSQNAVRIQILCALIAHLLMAILRRTHAPEMSLRRYLDLLRATLFQRSHTEAAVEQRRRRRERTQAAMQPGLFA